LYESIAEGHRVDNAVLVAGYIVMRIALVAQWLRAAKQDPERRSSSLTYAAVVVTAQIGWVVTIFLHSIVATYLLSIALACYEMLGPYIAERRTSGTPWHPHHIAERYGLLTIIALGEGVVGTVASLSAVVSAQGWSVAAALVAVAGTGLTFGMWWGYFVVPQSELLSAHRERAFWFGYLHFIVFGAIVATGAGLHVAAYYIEHHSKLDAVGTVLCVAIPVGVYIAMLYVLYMLMVHTIDAFHVLLMVLTAGVLVAAVVFAGSGMSMANSLLIVMLAPVVTVVGYELLGHRHAAQAVARQTTL
jgi:low temperature requirement protein LtrA